MSALAAAVSLGIAGAAEGELKSVDVVGYLHLESSAAWHFHRLDAQRELAAHLSFPSHGYGAFWTEVAGAFAVLMPDVTGLDPLSGEVARSDLLRLAAVAGDLNVGAKVALTDSADSQALAVLRDVPGWSVAVAGPLLDRRFSRWGTTDTRARNHIEG